MTSALLFDTDVLIEYLRGRKQAGEYFSTLEADRLFVASITIAELYAGVRSEEEAILRDFLNLFEVVEFDGELARKAGYLRNRYGSSHGTGLADAVIAASVVAANARLVTFNERHYPMIDDIVVPWSR